MYPAQNTARKNSACDSIGHAWEPANIFIRFYICVFRALVLNLDSGVLRVSDRKAQVNADVLTSGLKDASPPRIRVESLKDSTASNIDEPKLQTSAC